MIETTTIIQFPQIPRGVHYFSATFLLFLVIFRYVSDYLTQSSTICRFFPQSSGVKGLFFATAIGIEVLTRYFVPGRGGWG